MAWTGLSREKLDSLIADALAAHDDDVRAHWARIRIEPEKWRCSPWGDEGGGFWAVAIDEDQVLWFNDIEDGFNFSPFTERGAIDTYGCVQTDFGQILEQIAQAQSDRAWAKLRPTDVPADLTAPGTIVRRQTTYWDLRSAAGASYRVHFRDKVEAVFARADYSRVELLARHPLLAAHDEPSRSLYFSGAPADARTVAEAVDHAIRDVSQGWRTIVDHAGDVADVQGSLKAGHGLLMCAPESVCSAVAPVLERAGVSTSILDGAPGRPGKRVLLLGRSFVIAGAFSFERRDAAR